MKLAKLHGLGNDFLVALGAEAGSASQSLSSLAMSACRRHTGVGADGVVFYQPTVGDADADFSALIYNADGSRAEMSGNGTRCLAAYLIHSAASSARSLRIRTVSGIKTYTLKERVGRTYVFVSMLGCPIIDCAAIPIRLGSRTGPLIGIPLEVGTSIVPVTISSMGNPHCSTFWPDVTLAPVEILGPQLERHSSFPNRTNVEFIQVIDRHRIRVRFWERGVGRTLASGTGSAGAVVAAILNRFVESPVTVEVEEGSLVIRWQPPEELVLTGPAEYICSVDFPGTDKLMIAPLDLLGYFSADADKQLSLLKTLVEMESNSLDKGGVDRLAEFLAQEFENLGATAEILLRADSGNVLKAVWPSMGSEKPLLILAHLDTVWPAGTITERPFTVSDGKAYGPGIYDMKSGVLLCLLLCRALRDRVLQPDRDAIFFFMPDEEIGSAGGLEILETTARTAGAVLCLEPPLPGGKAKTHRKGVGTFRLRITGIAAHAGVEPEKGASAILEMSRQIIKLQRLNSGKHGISVSVGTVKGGSAVNVVPGFAEAEIDFRFTDLAAGRRLERRIRSSRPHDDRCRFDIEGGINRPPLVRSGAVTALFQQARAFAAAMGMDLGEGGTGGGSDGSFTAALGIPTLDGLGVEGDGAHATHEHIMVADLPRRAALLGMMLQELII